MTVIRRSHAYRDGSMVAECGYPRRPREPMDARKPTCPVCLKIERQRSQLERAVGTLAEVRLYAEKMLRSGDGNTRIHGADLLGIIDPDAGGQ
jgi:hypothetical protein